MGKSMYGLAQTLDSHHRFDESIVKKKEVLRILERSGDITMISKVSTSLGNDLRQIKKYEEANNTRNRGQAGPHGRRPELARLCAGQFRRDLYRGRRLAAR